MKIAVLRANGLGDFIFVLPALMVLRAHFSHAEIVYLGCPWHREYLPAHTDTVDRVIVIPPGNGVRRDGTEDPQELRDFFLRMRTEQFDVALQLHGGGRFSNPFVSSLGALQTIGLQAPDAPSLDVSVPYVYYQNEYIRYLEVMAAVGMAAPILLPLLSVTATDSEELRLSPDKRPYVVLHPGATDLRRRWAAEKFSLVGDWCVGHGYQVCITGTLVEQQVVDRLISHMKQPQVNLCGKLTLSGLTGIISRAACVISNDTGPYHLAYALGTPAVGIFWAGNMVNSAPLFRRWHRAVPSWMIHCPLCGEDMATPGFPFRPSKTCDHLTSFVDPVPVDQVLTELKDMLEK